MPPQAGPKARPRRCIIRAKRTTGAAAPLPRGGIPSENSAPNRRGGYTGGRRRVQRRVPRRLQRRGRGPGVGPGEPRRPVRGQGCGACQRSSTRRRLVPNLPPTVAGAPWSRPGGQGRMSGTPPPRRPSRCSHSSLAACPGTPACRPRSVAGRGRAFGACCFAGKLRSPALRTGATRLARARWRAGGPYVIPYVNPYVIPYALGVRTPGFAGRAHQCWSVPLRGASQPQKPRLTGPPQGEWSGQAEWCASRD